MKTVFLIPVKVVSGEGIRPGYLTKLLKTPYFRDSPLNQGSTPGRFCIEGSDGIAILLKFVAIIPAL